MKLNQNHFGIMLDESVPPGFSVASGESKTLKLKCSLGKNPGGTQPQRPPVLVQAGIKCNIDLFYFNIPALLQVLLGKQTIDPTYLQRVWMEVPSNPENYLQLPSMSSQISNAHAMITRLQDNNIFFMSQGQNEHGQDALYVYAVPEGSIKQEESVVGEISISMLDGGITVQAKSMAPYMSGLMLQAVKFVL